MKKGIRCGIVYLLVLSTAGMTLPQSAGAGMIATQSIEVAANRDRVAAALARVQVRSQLEAYGVNLAELQARVDALTDGEVAQLAARLESLPAGGEGFIGALVLVFLVLLITDIVGLTKVFPFTRPIR